MARGATAAGRAPRPLPRWLVLAATGVLLLAPVGGGILLLTTDGWAVNRANVAVWQATVVPMRLGSLISPEDFAVAANVLLFVPFFAALAVLVPRWWWVPVAAALSTAVELYQLGTGTREASVGDVLANTLGALIGVAVGRAVRRASTRPVTADASSAAGATPGPSVPAAPDAAPADPGRGPAGARGDRG